MVVSTFYSYWKYFAPFIVCLAIVRMIYNVISRSKMKSLRGQVVVVTGASSGIGESLAKSLYLKGAQVIMISRRLPKLETLKNELLEMNDSSSISPEPHILVMDIADLNSISKKIDDIIKTYGRIDVLINNAGILCRGDIADLSMKVFQDVMAVNFFGVVALTKAVLPNMIERKEGHIVAISSVQGLMAVPRRSAYAASKHALVAYMDSLRAEVCDSSINVTCIHPGYVNTNISYSSLTGEGVAHNCSDPNILNGYSPDYIANKIVEAIEQTISDMIICPNNAKLAILLRTLCPSLQFSIMRRISKSEVYY